MGSQQDVLDCYEALAPLTSQMLDAARAGQWDDLSLLEKQFRATVALLKDLRPDDQADDQQKARKYRLLRRILADDAEIRNLITPQMAGLSELIGTTARRQKLVKAYEV